MKDEICHRVTETQRKDTTFNAEIAEIAASAQQGRRGRPAEQAGATGREDGFANPRLSCASSRIRLHDLLPPLRGAASNFIGSFLFSVTLCLCGMFFFLLVAVSAQSPALKVEALESPAGASSSVPQMTAAGDRVVLSWVEREGATSTLKFSERTATGWSAPRVVIASEKLMVNSADVPSVRAMPEGFAAHWMMESGPDPEAYDLRVAWSADGKTWTTPVAPNRDKTMTQHGFATLFPTADGGTGVIWLDGRTTHGDEGDMQLRAAMFDKGHKSLSDSLIDSRVCECCATSVALGADGPIAAYRNRTTAEIRDIYVTRLSAGKWSMPARVHADNFKIEACPINGPAIAANGKDVVVAWFTAPNEMERSYVAFSHDGGRTFGKATRVEDEGTLGRMQVALTSDGAAVVGWVEFANEKSTFKVRRIDASGARGPSVAVAPMSGTRFPRMAVAKNEAVLAWTETEKDSSRVKTARIAIK